MRANIFKGDERTNACDPIARAHDYKVRVNGPGHSSRFISGLLQTSQILDTALDTFLVYCRIMDTVLGTFLVYCKILDTVLGTFWVHFWSTADLISPCQEIQVSGSLLSSLRCRQPAVQSLFLLSNDSKVANYTV